MFITSFFKNDSMELSLFDKLFVGEHKYTVGLLFIFGNMAGYFLNMRKIKVDDMQSFQILMCIIFVARLVV